MGVGWCQAPPSPHCPLAGLPVLARVHVWDLCPPLTLLAWQADSSVSGLVRGQFHWMSQSPDSQCLDLPVFDLCPLRVDTK